MEELSIEELRRSRRPIKEAPSFGEHIKDSKELISEALETLLLYQSGDLKPIKFRRNYLNDNLLGGLYPGNVVTIAGASSMGKSHFLQEMEDDIFDKDLNPDSDDYILLRHNFEISTFKLFLRELKFKLEKKIGSMLESPFTEEEMALVKKIQEKESNPNIKYFEHPQTADEWFKIVSSFCEKYKDKKHIILSIDHIALTKSSGDKKGGIDSLVENMNTLRKIYSNVSFIILSQLNRNIEDRTEAKHAAPRKSDLYQSDFLYQISDVVFVVHQPYKWGIQEYMVMGQSQYGHLSEFKKDPNKKTTTFTTKGNVFIHFIKLREDEGNTLNTLYIETLYKPRFRLDYQQKDLGPEVPRMEPNLDLFETEQTPFD